MMWFLLLGLGVLVFLAAVILAILGARTLSPRIPEDATAQDSESRTTMRPTRDVALIVVAAVFLLQACCILVAFIASRVQFGANPWG